MISFLLFLIQFAIDYVMLVVHLYFIIQALVIFTPSTWFRPLHTGGLTSQDVTLLLALCLIIPALLSRFSFFQSILLHVNGARRAKGDDLAYIEACLDPVLQKAGLRRSDFTLYIQDTAELNAYAFGDHHIVVFKGLLDQLPMDEVSGVLAHELGHLHYHHTQWLLLSYGMNLPITFVSGIYRAIVFMLRIFLIIPILGLLISLMVFFCNLWIQALSFTMNFPLHLLRLVKARQDEYAADRYTFEIGYGVELHNALFDISGGGADAPGFFGRLWSDHPVTRKRLEKLRELVTQVEGRDAEQAE